MDSQDFMNISYHSIHVSCMRDRPIHGSLEKKPPWCGFTWQNRGMCSTQRSFSPSDETLNRGLVLVLPLAVDWGVKHQIIHMLYDFFVSLKLSTSFHDLVFLSK